MLRDAVVHGSLFNCSSGDDSVAPPSKSKKPDIPDTTAGELLC